MSLPIENRISDLVSPLLEKTGLRLYDVEFQGRTLRISIEKFEGGGVSIEDCVEASRMINPLLDVEDVIPGGSYELEVSSPGLNRILRKPDHFAKAVGTRVHVSTHEPLSTWNQGPLFENRKNVTGDLAGFDGNQVTIRIDGNDVIIPLGAIAKSRIEFELKTTPKKGQSKKAAEKLTKKS